MPQVVNFARCQVLPRKGNQCPNEFNRFWAQLSILGQQYYHLKVVVPVILRFLKRKNISLLILICSQEGILVSSRFSRRGREEAYGQVVLGVQYRVDQCSDASKLNLPLFSEIKKPTSCLRCVLGLKKIMRSWGRLEKILHSRFCMW